MVRTPAERQREFYRRHREAVLANKKLKNDNRTEEERGRVALYRMTRYYQMKGGHGVPREKLEKIRVRYPSCEAIRQALEGNEQ